MRGRILALLGVAVAVAGLGVSSVPAGAAGGSNLTCNKTVNGGTVNGVVKVPKNGTCILNGVTVVGNVNVGPNAYFESSGSSIGGNVNGTNSLTIYIHSNTSVAGGVIAYYTAQVYVYDSTVGRNVASVGNGPNPGFGHFQVCGTTAGIGISAAFVGPDILIGDPGAGCGANTANKGFILAASSTADSEVYVIGNTAQNADIDVYSNSGVGDKQVHQNNAPNGDIYCQGNSSPFDGSGNGTVGDVEGGQCTATTITGIDPDDGGV